MHLLYCTHSTYNPGGMERVLFNKVTYLRREKGWDITIVTTDQQGRKPFYPFPSEVRMIDLGINYTEDNKKHVVRKIAGYLWKRRKHKVALTKLLQEMKPDIVVSLYPSESSFLPDIQDGSKKVLELHYCKFFRLQYGRKGLLGLIDQWRTRQDERIVRRFDKFVVLTQEDQGYWGALPNIQVIPNAALSLGEHHSDVSAHRAIAVGRLDYQKGFDRLIDAWALVMQDPRFADWKLDLFGQGEWHDLLQQRILDAGITHSVCLHQPTTRIAEEYAASSFLVMSSHYEGFPMVMIEAMSCGLPVISFDYQCGPRDIISHTINGLLVPDGDINGLAEAMMEVMVNDEYRRILSFNACLVTETYSEKNVMDQWIDLFSSLARQ